MFLNGKFKAVEGQLTPLAPLGCNTASFKLTHESGVNSSCSLIFIGEKMQTRLAPQDGHN